MQIEETLINDHLRMLKVSWKFHIPIIYKFAVTEIWNLLSEICYFLKKQPTF